jgi:hypothetical protein
VSAVPLASGLTDRIEARRFATEVVPRVDS